MIRRSDYWRLKEFVTLSREIIRNLDFNYQIKRGHKLFPRRGLALALSLASRCEFLNSRHELACRRNILHVLPMHDPSNHALVTCRKRTIITCIDQLNPKLQLGGETWKGNDLGKGQGRDIGAPWTPGRGHKEGTWRERSYRWRVSRQSGRRSSCVSGSGHRCSSGRAPGKGICKGMHPSSNLHTVTINITTTTMPHRLRARSQDSLVLPLSKISAIWPNVTQGANAVMIAAWWKKKKIDRITGNCVETIILYCFFAYIFYSM